MIKFNGEIGFSQKTGTMYLANGINDTPAPKETIPTNDIVTNFGIAPWGANNLLPTEMVKLIEECGVLGAGIDGKARFGLGKGPTPFILNQTNPDGSEDLTPVDDGEILDWIEENDLFTSAFGWFKDMIGLGNNIARYKFSNDGNKIGLCWRHDVSEMRFTQKNDKGVVEKVVLNANWQTGISGNSTLVDMPNGTIVLPLIPRIGPLNFLESLKPSQRRAKEFAFTNRLPAWNRHYYSMPLWYAALKWINIAKGVPDMKAAMFNNIIRLQYIVVIHDTYWTRTYPKWDSYSTDERQGYRDQLMDDIDSYLSGANNSYKSIYVNGWIDPVTKERVQDIEVKPIAEGAGAGSMKGELLPDSAAANSEILFALMMNPALMGADTPGGPYSGGSGSGSNIREAALVQVMIQEFERHDITRKLSLVQKVNNWAPNKKLVWRFPGWQLTTLDKGKSTQEIKN